MQPIAILMCALACMGCVDSFDPPLPPAAPYAADEVFALDCGGALPESAQVLDAPMFQLQSNWCWAAVTTMAAKSQGVETLDQCEIVSVVFHASLGEGANNRTCCSAIRGVQPDCDQGGYPDMVARNLYDLDVEKTAALSAPDRFRRALANGHMAAIGLINEQKTQGHVMAVTGYDGLGADGTFTLDDPLHGRLKLTYDKLPLGFHETYKTWSVRETFLFGTKTRTKRPNAC